MSLPTPDELDGFFENLRGQVPVLPKRTEGPFLSVLTRTQGRRMGTLKEALEGLVSQSNQDFEVLLLLHRVPEDARRRIEDLVATMPIASKVRFLAETGGRTTPLNV